MFLLTVLISMFLAGFLGFTSHRAGLCTVRAVAEMLIERRAALLLCFAKTALWAMVVTLPVLWLAPHRVLATTVPASILPALLGGLLFGVGAALNGGCAFSTLQALVDGELAMLATLAGFCCGSSALAWLPAGVMPAATKPLLAGAAVGDWWPMLPVGLLWLWAIGQLLRLWRARRTGSVLRRLVDRVPYPLSAAAVVLGLSGAILFLLHGSWTYTRTLRQGVAALLGHGGSPSLLLFGLFLAILVGMLLSSWQRAGFRLRHTGWQGWLRHWAGGALMGLGGILIPGGNDSLVLSAIPSLLPLAPLSYLAILAGAALVLGPVHWRRPRGGDGGKG